jgi:predicted  nucleic acid-binding Zn-ribbon protein
MDTPNPKNIRALRTTLARTPPDTMSRLDLYERNAMLGTAMASLETSLSLLQRTHVMTTSTLETGFDLLLADSKTALLETARQVAEGQEIPVERFREILWAANCSVEEFRGLVKDAEAWKSAVETLERLADGKEHVAGLLADKEAAAEAIRVEAKRHEKAMEELNRKQSVADEAYSSATRADMHAEANARSTLNRLLSDEAKQRFNQLSDRTVKVANRIPPLHDEHRSLKFRVERLRALAGGAENNLPCADANDRLRSIADAKAELPKLEKRLATVATDLEQARADHSAAKAEFDRFQSVDMRDVRNMRFARIPAEAPRMVMPATY